MKQLLAVCVRALRHLEIAEVSSPSIFVVLNQMADTNRDHHIQAFQVIELELIKMFEELLPFPSCLFSPFLLISRHLGSSCLFAPLYAHALIARILLFSLCGQAQLGTPTLDVLAGEPAGDSIGRVLW